MTAETLHILHTADLHLGTPFTALTDDRARRTLRDEHPRLLHELVRLVKAHAVDVLLIAGDLFDTPQPDPRLLEQVLHSFRRMAPCRIFLIAGNHDPCAPGSFWYTADWPEHVHVFRPGEPARVCPDDLPITVDGYSFRDVYQREPLWEASSDNASGKSPGPTPDTSPRFRILLAHGDLVSGGSESHYHPIHLNRLPDRYDYAALGHVHLPGSGEIARRQGLWRYPGTPQGRGFDELGVRGYALGTVTRRHDARYSSPFEQHWEMLPSGGRPFLILPVPVDGVATIQASLDATDTALRGAVGARGIFPYRTEDAADEADGDDPVDREDAHEAKPATDDPPTDDPRENTHDDHSDSTPAPDEPPEDPEAMEALKRACIRLVFQGSPESPLHPEYIREVLLDRGYFYLETRDATTVAYDEETLRGEAGFHRMLMDVIDERMAENTMDEARRDAVLPLILRAEQEVRNED